jgi:hypothetical protein
MLARGVAGSRQLRGRGKKSQTEATRDAQRFSPAASLETTERLDNHEKRLPL